MIDWEAFKRQIQANPNKMLGYILGIAACFLLIWMLVVMQIDSSGQTVTVNQSGRLDSLRISMSRPASDSAAAANGQNVSPSPHEENTSPFANALPTFLILLAAIGGLWYWIKKGNSANGRSVASEKGLFTPIGTKQIAGGHQISVIKINNEFWVLGIGSQEMKLLHRYPESEWNGLDASVSEEEKSGGKLFANILRNKQAREIRGQNGSD